MAQVPAPEGYTETGYLRVAAQTARGAIPIVGAAVSVSGEVENDIVLYANTVTNISGETEDLSLPAPARALSQTPGNPRPFAVYTVTARAEGYYPMIYESVPVFSGIKSIVNVAFLPVLEGDTAPAPRVISGGETRGGER